MATQFVERKYQQESLYGGRGEYPGIFQGMRESKSILVDMATGTGKTYIAAKAMKAIYDKGHRILVVAHLRNLVNQMVQGIVKTGLFDPAHIGIEMAGQKSRSQHRIVVASTASLVRRLDRFPREFFKVIFFDEAHHYPPESSATPIIEHFVNAWRVGFTATPERADGKDIRKVFKRDAFSYNLVEAIEERFLVPVVLHGEISKDIDLGSVTNANGSCNVEALGEMMSSDPVVAFVAQAIVKRTGDRTTMAFTVTTAQAIAVSEFINHIEPGTSRWVCGRGTNVPEGYHATTDVELAENVAWLAEATGRRIINCLLFSEGTDLPFVDCIVVARPAGSKAFLTQLVGRGTRLRGGTWEESVTNGKSNVLVLDLTGATPRSAKRQQASVLDLMDGGTCDDEVRERALKKSLEGPVDAMTVLDEAAAEILAEQREKALKDVGFIRTVEMGGAYLLLGIKPRAGKLGGKPATVEQLRVLDRHHIPGARQQLKAVEEGKKIKKGIDYGQALELKDAIARRDTAGLCSPRQAKQLIQRGLNPDAKKEDARAAMHLFSNNGTWRPVSESAVAELLIRWPGLAPKAVA